VGRLKPRLLCVCRSFGCSSAAIGLLVQLSKSVPHKQASTILAIAAFQVIQTSHAATSLKAAAAGL
jgi:hypothetical protein